MKCNELMVGDWIADEYGFPMQVTSVGKDSLNADFEDNEGDVIEFDDKDCKPYPMLLGDEFFERNNFDVEILAWTEGSRVYGEGTKDGYIIAIACSNIPISKVYYVHELQQLLRLGGYAKLANNVKV